jgi:2-(1,2-epoxy-1,2-dihydrophenyl)acetyl-CoA isomerase
MSDILVEQDGAVGIITIARRARMNSLDVTTARDLRKAGLTLTRDRAVRAIVLRGDGGVFCSGADLKYIRSGGADDDLDYLKAGGGPPRATGYGAIFKQILEYLHATISELRRAPKPVIAAVDGAAAAGGFGLAMACDLVLASDRATFEWAYFKTGLTGAESTTFFLPQLVGLRRALALAYLSPRLDAREALDLGLITAIHPVESLDVAARALAAKLAAGPTEAMAVAKGLMNAAVGGDRLSTHLDRELEELARIADGPDFAEGLDAFFGKRPPVFPGPAARGGR